MHLVYAKRTPEIIDCGPGVPGYSFYFNLIASLWGDCKAEGAIHRICSLMRKMGAKTLVREELEPSNEILQEFEDLKTRIGRDFLDNPVAYRLSFFSSPCPDKDLPNLLPSSFLGYAVVLKTKMPTDVEIVKEKFPSGDLSYLLEAVTRPPGRIYQNENNDWVFRQVTNYYVHCKKEFQTSIGTCDEHKDFCVDGVFFCQQNTLTHVCAHAALRTMLNTCEGLVDHKVTNRELNTILGIDHSSKTAENGLTPPQMEKVAKHFKLNILSANLLNQPTVDYAEWIYPLIESGYPVLLTFQPTHNIGHVVAVVGHTLNSDKWDCEAHLAYRPEALGTYHASSAWVDHFIVNDDNFGMYTCMPPGYLRNRLMPQYDLTQRAIYALSLLPASADVPPYLAEKAAIQLLSKLAEIYTPASNNRWLLRLWEQVKQPNRGIVARTLMLEKNTYIQSLQSQSGNDSDGQGPVKKLPDQLANAPDNLWITEISLPDLYTANKHKLGDILTDAKAGVIHGQKKLKFVWGWLPGIQVPQNPDTGTIPPVWPLTGHIPLLRTKNILGPGTEW